jgi:hypothetical protein
MTKNDVSDTGISQKLAEVHDRISAAGVSNEDLDIILAAVVALASRHPQPVNEPVEWQVEKAARAIHWEQYEDPAQAEHEWNHWAGSADYARKLARSALRAASIPAPERSKGEMGVMVKPLEWVDGERGFPTDANTIIGRYRVWDFDGEDSHYMRPEDRAGLYVGGNLDHAKAAAQADYERHIMSALSVPEPPSPASGQEPVAWVTADILAAMKRGERVVPGWKYSADFCIPLYAHPPADKPAGEEVTVTDEMVGRLIEVINEELIEAEVDYPAGREAGHRIEFDEASMASAIRAALTAGDSK